MTDNNSHTDEMNSETEDDATPAGVTDGNGGSSPEDKPELRERTTDADEQPQHTRNRQQTTRQRRLAKQKIAGYLYWGTFGGVFLLGTFAAFGFYQSVIEIIDIWVSEDFKPIYRAVFNLLVVLLSVLGISLLVRRLGVSFSPTGKTSSSEE